MGPDAFANGCGRLCWAGTAGGSGERPVKPCPSGERIETSPAHHCSRSSMAEQSVDNRPTMGSIPTASTRSRETPVTQRPECCPFKSEVAGSNPVRCSMNSSRTRGALHSAIGPKSTRVQLDLLASFSGRKLDCRSGNRGSIPLASAIKPLHQIGAPSTCRLPRRGEGQTEAEGCDPPRSLGLARHGKQQFQGVGQWPVRLLREQEIVSSNLTALTIFVVLACGSGAGTPNAGCAGSNPAGDANRM